MVVVGWLALHALHACGGEVTGDASRTGGLEPGVASATGGAGKAGAAAITGGRNTLGGGTASLGGVPSWTGGRPAATGGAATCPIGEADCGGYCADLLADQTDCGACDNVCPNGVCSGGVCLGPACIPPWFAQQINVLVLGDANVSNADTRGALWVGGHLTGVGYDVGPDLPPDPTCTRYDLAVAGDINLSGWLVLHNGVAAYGGSLTVTGVMGAECGVYHAPADMPNFAQIASDVESYSAYLAGLPATGTVSGSTLNGGSSSCRIVVFDTELCDFADVTISIPADGTAIVNSTCPNPTFNNGQTSIIMGGVTQPQCNGQSGSGGACDRILYNFPNATTVEVNGMMALGSILAPYAKFTGNRGNVAGEVIVGSMDTGIEFHAWFFEGCLDTTTC
jgi:choice-of-anchor A domain-containing protein